MVDGGRKALIIANDQYEQELRKLQAPAADAAELGRVLADPHIGDFSVRDVCNQPSYVIQAEIEDLFADGRPDDLLLLHFSCHGLKNDSGELFFAAPNTRTNRLGSTAVSAEFIHSCMRACRSRKIVLLLDCCYGGAFSRGFRTRAGQNANVFDSFPRQRLGGGRGRVVITASSAMEYAFEGSDLASGRPEPSVFTSALVRGLETGAADRDEDGWVSLNELYDYIFDEVHERNPHQTPSRQVDLQGELYIARSPAKRIRPAPKRSWVPGQGRDIETEITLPFEEAMQGTVVAVKIDIAGDTQTINLRIPAGVADNQRVVLRGRGMPGAKGKPSGDLFVLVAVLPHAVFGRQGDDLTVTVPVTFPELILGAEIQVPALGRSPITVRMPPGTPSGRRFRVPGLGIAVAGRDRGNLIVTVDVIVPSTVDGIARAALEQLRRADAETGPEMRSEMIVVAARESRVNDKPEVPLTDSGEERH